MMLPRSLEVGLQHQLARRAQMHAVDIARGMVDVELPHALAQKYPNAPREWAWQWVFAADDYSTCPRTGAIRRHHLHPKTLNRTLANAARRAGISKHVTAHTVSHEQRTKKDEGLDLQLISIRMPRSLIDDLKEIARLNNQKLTGAVRRPVERRVRPC